MTLLVFLRALTVQESSKEGVRGSTVVVSRLVQFSDLHSKLRREREFGVDGKIVFRSDKRVVLYGVWNVEE